MRRARRGFTLIEVAVGLAIASILLLTARSILDGVSDNSARIARAAAAADYQANAHRLLRQLLRTALHADGDSVSFVGNERMASFRSWCPGSGGWRERCSVTLVVEREGDSSALVLYPSGKDERIEVGSAAGPLSLRFIKDERSPLWLPVWAESRQLPRALAIVGVADTTILKVGDAR